MKNILTGVKNLQNIDGKKKALSLHSSSYRSYKIRQNIWRFFHHLKSALDYLTDIGGKSLVDDKDDMGDRISLVSLSMDF